MSLGWPGCLRTVAATVLLIQEARKFPLGQRITVYVPHMVITVLEQKGGRHRLSPSRMLKYQVVLLEQDDVYLKTATVVNPAVFLTTDRVEGDLERDCLQTIEEVYSSRPDLRDAPLEETGWELYTGESSFIREGERSSGHAVTATEKVIESRALPSSVSA